MTRLAHLSALRASDAPRVGAKAARLAELLSRGFSVPPGFVAPPGCPEEALRAGLASLSAARFAVRSSGVEEDDAHASWAGQLTSFLNVPPDEVVEAVARCRDAAREVAATAYASRHGREAPSIPVLVQEMVPADAAGVAFSAHPISGDRGEVVVHAVKGLGDRLTAGEVEPEVWRVGDGAPQRDGGADRVLDVDDARRVAELARACEVVFGAPQDVEWALADGRLHVVQSRPITALPDPVLPIPIVVPPGQFWELEDVHFPEPLSAAMRWLLPNHTRVFRTLFDEFGLLAEGLDHVEIGGRVYMAIVPLGGRQPPRQPPRWLARWLVAVMGRVVPAFRRRLATAARVVREERQRMTLAEWETSGRQATADLNRALRKRPMTEMSGPALATHLGDLVDHACATIHTHMALAIAVSIELAQLVFFCRDHLGWGTAQTVRLLVGQSKASTVASEALGPLAALAAERPPVAEFLAGPGTDLAHLEGVDPEFARLLLEWLETYGCRALRYDVIEPCIDECPELVAALVQARIARATQAADPPREVLRKAVAEEARRGIEPGRRTEFDELLDRAAHAYGVREDNEAYTLSVPLALLRKALLVAGERLAASGVIRARDDVFMLEVPEVQAALTDGRDRTATARRRRAEHAWARWRTAPRSYGTDPGGPPPLDLLPAHGRFPTEVMTWITGEDMLAVHAGNGTLAGHAASPGSYIGPARVVSSESEFIKLRPGDVLVCRIPAPVWSVWFGSIGALVTDAGGALSHGAIIAREFGIPAVLGTGSATSTLRDGQTVRVDGTRGVVEVVT